MTTPVLADPHRLSKSGGSGFASSPAGEGSSLDLPVLFQLTDLSQYKVLQPVAVPKADRKSPNQILKTAEKEAPSLRQGTSGQSSSAASASGEDAASRAKGDLLSPASEAVLAPADIHVPLNAEQAATPAADSPTIRERARLRERRRQAAAKGDWFQTQGKYIVVVFLILLAGTIYVARNGDDTPPSPMTDPSLLVDVKPQEAGPLSPGDDAQAKQSLDAESVAPFADESPAVTAVSPATDALDETSPANADSPPFVPAAELASGPEIDAPAPSVSLEAPVSAAVPNASAGRGENLFPWANQQEASQNESGRDDARVATRPQPSPHLPSPNPHYQARPASPGMQGSAPQPRLPEGGAAGESPNSPMPGEQPAHNVYPVVDPIQYPVADPATQRGSPPPPGPAANAVPASYENRVPTAPSSGPRHERTGSGLY